MKKALFLLLFLCSYMTSWGQVEYNKIKTQADRWYGSAVSEEVLSKGAKNKTVGQGENHVFRITKKYVPLNR